MSRHDFARHESEEREAEFVNWQEALCFHSTGDKLPLFSHSKVETI